MAFDKRVELVGILQHPGGNWGAEDYASSGARGCFSELSSDRIQKEETMQPDYKARKDVIFRETSGRGHGAVLDQAEFVFAMDNLSRASTLFLCGPQYGSHLQQSLRRATAERGFFPVDIPEADKIMAEQFKLYNAMQSSNIPAEDARFILPLNTKTTIQTKWDARELMHLYSMAQRMQVPSEVKDTAEQMYFQSLAVAPQLMKDRKNNLEVLAWMPSPQLFAKENPTIGRITLDIPDYFTGAKILNSSGRGLMTAEEIKEAVMTRDEALLANMKHYHFTFVGAMSLAAFHQATRQRTWDQSVEALPSAIKRGGYVTPPSIIGTEFEKPYRKLNEKSILFGIDNLANPESYGVIPHSLKVYDMIHVNGWNAVHSIGKRTCTEAQWEIRGVATDMANAITEYDADLGRFAKPQGVTYGRCPEKKPCGKCFENN